jgi:peptidoglycan/LPS O-acetylase OafA/YrhL
MMDSSRPIPSLDGLRACAVISVILGHTQSHWLDRIPMNIVFRDGEVGVNLFFVISGFLITHLLLREQDRTGDIDLKRFYLRRSFRIFPAFYLFLAGVAVLRLLGVYAFDGKSFLSAALYSWNYTPHADGWILGHTWSLSLEEQFYLLWPAAVLLLSRRRCLQLAVLIILLSPLLRVGTYLLFPVLRGHINMMLHTHLDTMMVGCALTLATSLHVGSHLLHTLARPIWLIPIAGYLFLLAPWLEASYRGSFYLPLGITLTSLCCGMIVLACTRHPDSLAGRFLHLSWLRHIGLISYGLYLWQQMFTGPDTRWFPLNLLCIVLCAEASYRLIEQPCFRLRDHLASRHRSPRERHLDYPMSASERS